MAALRLRAAHAIPADSRRGALRAGIRTALAERQLLLEIARRPAIRLLAVAGGRRIQLRKLQTGGQALIALASREREAGVEQALPVLLGTVEAAVAALALADVEELTGARAGVHVAAFDDPAAAVLAAAGHTAVAWIAGDRRVADVARREAPECGVRAAHGPARLIGEQGVGGVVQVEGRRGEAGVDEQLPVEAAAVAPVVDAPGALRTLEEPADPPLEAGSRPVGVGAGRVRVRVAAPVHGARGQARPHPALPRRSRARRTGSRGRRRRHRH